MTTENPITNAQFNEAVARYQTSRRQNPKLDGVSACSYTHPVSGKHCVAGQIMSDLGLPVPAPGSIEPSSSGIHRDMNTEVIKTLPKHYTGRLSAEMIHKLAVAQNSADLGRTWRQALKGAQIRDDA